MAVNQWQDRAQQEIRYEHQKFLVTIVGAVAAILGSAAAIAGAGAGIAALIIHWHG